MSASFSRSAKGLSLPGTEGARRFDLGTPDLTAGAPMLRFLELRF